MDLYSGLDAKDYGDLFKNTTANESDADKWKRVDAIAKLGKSSQINSQSFGVKTLEEILKTEQLLDEKAHHY